jgi:hypothetical protein
VGVLVLVDPVVAVLLPPEEPPGALVPPEELMVVPAVVLQAVSSSRSSTSDTDRIDIQRREYNGILGCLNMILPPVVEQSVQPNTLPTAEWTIQPHMTGPVYQ